MPTPEAAARENIDAALQSAGWHVQDFAELNLAAGLGVAVREFPLARGHGKADYALYVAGKLAGVVEAKKEGTLLTGIEVQSEKYARGVPPLIPAHVVPLPFLYESTGVETQFTNRLDPEPRSRRLFHFHTPETLAEWLDPEQNPPPLLPLENGKPAPRSLLPSTLRLRLRQMPDVEPKGLWPAQLKAVRNLEASLYAGKPRALIQMATGSGKTFTAVSSIYRLIKSGGAKRVLFLVDRANLGRQTLKEFQQYVTPDDGRKFHELYNVQHLTSNKLDPVAKVCIATIQRVYSMLSGQELKEDDEEISAFTTLTDLSTQPLPVPYNPSIPVEFFDFLWTDEAHRSIYNLWRQVLEYFDSFLIGLTATPSKQTLGFFHQNLVMEYGHEAAVGDSVNVPFDVYRIRTRITEGGSKVEAGLFVDKRDRESRAVRWQKLDEDLTYSANQLDRDVVAEDQLRTVIRTFKDRLFTEIFPGRKEVPKTLIFAKDDSHADDIVRVVREEFGKGNAFCEKITYRTGTARLVTKKKGPGGKEVEEVTYKATGIKPEDLLSSFRNSYNPRIAVTVDMVATGTDIKPLEIVMFMRTVKSRNFFEQMKGRGVRVISPSDLQSVTPDAPAKTHFILVDCVGMCESDFVDTRPLEKQPAVAFDKLLHVVAAGGTDREVISSLASRLARMNQRLGKPEKERLARLAHGKSLEELVGGLVEALDPDRHVEAARVANKLLTGEEPTAAQVSKAAEAAIRAAVAPLAANPDLRNELAFIKRSFEQTLDTVSVDTVLGAGFDAAATEKARGLVQSFEQYIEEHKDELTAIQVLYSQPYAKRLTFKDIKALAEDIKAPPRTWTPEALWRAYETLDKSKVRGAGGQRLLTDIVSLVRFALHKDRQLVPFTDQVEERFQNWLAQQENRGRKFSEEQRQWLALIKDHVAASFRIERDDFEDVPFNQKGGLGRVHQVFAGKLDELLEELNEVLVA
ncbi:MAG TPA: type I restriction-modification enzyme R subunit C-terminal domain-containing protein [Archangium sp.]|uniref:type I restriction endonuclease subunit R n=1 Tax=Archangium sp. TaxID=1872627 RepID=UPI002E3525B6|nr:type I restriction-modification enzyme R subunit C-terminal domain-containing protein [Archangium sp.]HEX5749814.1 type I restriction-modification enzyme R subunit C-terminal domain-containing protein [Archangium sp.]